MKCLVRENQIKLQHLNCDPFWDAEGWQQPLVERNSKLILLRTSSITGHSDPWIINLIKNFSLVAKVIADTLKACKLDTLSQMRMGLAGVPEESSIFKLGKLH